MSKRFDFEYANPDDEDIWDYDDNLDCGCCSCCGCSCDLYDDWGDEDSWDD